MALNLWRRVPDVLTVRTIPPSQRSSHQDPAYAERSTVHDSCATAKAHAASCPALLSAAVFGTQVAHRRICALQVEQAARAQPALPSGTLTPPAQAEEVLKKMV
jgi:hypothetical protein